MGILLWIIAEVLSKFFNLLGLLYTIIYSFVTFKWIGGLKRLNKYFYQLALSKDQHSNVALQDLFNAIMLKKNSIKFGSEDQTISYYFAVNKLITDRSNGLNIHGRIWAFILDLFEYKKGGHLFVTLQSSYAKDMQTLDFYLNLTSEDHYKSITFEDYKNEIIRNYYESVSS
jgi:hypothetical protein